MKTPIFLAVVLVSGFSAGIVHGLVNLAVVEPYLDRAISIENQNRIASGEINETSAYWQEFNKYRVWQKEGSIISGGILGLATGALFGVIFAYSRKRLPGQHNVTKSLILGGIMWFTIFFIPFLKYPANPPTVGDPHTIVFRSVTYVLFVGLSGFGALAFAKLYQRMSRKKKYVAPLGYALYIVIVFLLIPQNPDKILAPMDLVNGFRESSLLTMTIYWVVNAIILGLLWQKFQPDSVTEM